MTMFDAVFDELRGTSGRILDTAGVATGIRLPKVSGNYGHEGVMSAWRQFAASMEDHVGTLKSSADRLGTDLNSAAGRYVEVESDTQATIGGLGGKVGGAAGAIGGVLGGGAGVGGQR
ncbi:hypothetical protein BJF85_15400 [Saccharomonospora sp. CUA-673]|nr:hypothetical protein BJF85_15400 [Saccharomonospora sp. CUA-673]